MFIKFKNIYKFQVVEITINPFAMFLDQLLHIRRAFFTIFRTFFFFFCNTFYKFLMTKK